MSKSIKVDTTIDITCPFSMMSSRRLENAIKGFESKHSDITFNVRVHPYLLQPDLSAEPISTDENSLKRFGAERFEMIKKGKAAKFAELGLKVPENGQISSTIPAHRLIALAGQTKPEAQWPLTLDLFQAHQIDGDYPANKDTLASLGKKYDIFSSDEEARAFLNSDKLEDVVRKGDQKARAEGVKSVPHYVFQGDNVSPNSKNEAEFESIFEQYV